MSEPLRVGYQSDQHLILRLISYVSIGFIDPTKNITNYNITISLYYSTVYQFIFVEINNHEHTQNL